MEGVLGLAGQIMLELRLIATGLRDTHSFTVDHLLSWSLQLKVKIKCSYISYGKGAARCRICSKNKTYWSLDT
jgi:hypothetical protein